MRTPIIAGNWKMNTTVQEAADLVSEMLSFLERLGEVESVLCPPFISLVPVGKLLRATSVKLGAQNMYFEEKGAFTGEVSPRMLAGLCQYVILGHSERRQYFKETDRLINRKVKAALAFGLNPILCVGERLEENEAGMTEEVVTRQVKKGLAGVKAPKSLVMAYEPVWAIGTGKAATGRQANDTIGLIRATLAELFGPQVAAGIRIQYGGSVNSTNAVEFIKHPEIDGALVGGASLQAKEFIRIVEQTAAIKRAR